MKIGITFDKFQVDFLFVSSRTKKKKCARVYENHVQVKGTQRASGCVLCEKTCVKITKRIN